MEKAYLPTLAIVSLVLALSSTTFAEEVRFQYPCYLLDAYDPDRDCWKGIGIDGDYQVRVFPEQWLVGSPPSDKSAVTMPTDHWVELQFRGRIVDGPGEDISLIELGPVKEQALVFITDGAGQEYLLDLATSGTTGSGVAPTEIAFDISAISLPFAPSAIRIVAIDRGGLSPGFDLNSVRARICISCGQIACNPTPVDGAKNVATDVVLSWSPGNCAASHDVYFGSNSADVNEADNSWPVGTSVYKGNQPLDANSYDPCGLELGKTYYWRIDEVNGLNTWIGDIWSFTVTDYLIVDNFESYNYSDNWIDNTWIETGGAFLYLSVDPVHGCEKQSMAFEYYYFSDFCSEVVRMFNPAQDWTAAGAKALEMFFYGAVENDANGQMYVALGDGDVNVVVPYAGDVNDLKNEAWQVWRIDLQDFTDVNLSNVKNISIGFCGGTPPVSTGAGLVYFDDIRLYSSRCLEENRPDADLTGDCVVNFEDLEEISYSWLHRRYNIYTVAAPNAPLAWYEFEGDANDSSGNQFHGDPCGSPTFGPGLFGLAISFDGHDDSVSITGAPNLFSNISTAITIAFWQYGADSPHHTDTLCCSDYHYGVNDPAIAINLGCWSRPQGRFDHVQAVGLTGEYNWDCGYPWSFDGRLSGDHRYKSEWSGRWNHWAFTKDTQAGDDPNKGEMKIYLNSVLFDSRTDANSTISAINSFEIGSGWYGGYDGLIDDFRIYDYALSQAEIAHAATHGTGIFHQPIMSPANLYNDNQIDFKDFAVLANNWLEERLWP